MHMKVFLIAAITVDGYIGRHPTHNATWTSSSDKKLFVELTKAAGIMIMGSRTFETIGRALPGRRTIVYTPNPAEYDHDDVEPTNESPMDLIARLEAEGAKAVAICGGASIYNLFMQSGVVQELYLTVEPLLFGDGIRLFGTELNISLQLLETRQLNKDSIMLHYAVINT